MKQQFISFLVRWGLNSFGLWVAVRLLGSLGAEFTGTAEFAAFVLAGFIFSLANAILKPIVIILSLPAILLTLGLFILVVNGFMVYISAALVSGIEMTFGAAIIAGIVMSLVNYVITGIFDLRRKEERHA
jgi:putative membrane protein